MKLILLEHMYVVEEYEVQEEYGTGATTTFTTTETVPAVAASTATSTAIATREVN